MFKIRNRHFVSDEDQFIKEFNQAHPELTQDQQKEISKHKRIAKMRDQKISVTKENKIWREF